MPKQRPAGVPNDRSFSPMPPDFSATSTATLLAAIEPMRAASPELCEYIRRQEAHTIHERDILRHILQIVTLPCVAIVDFEATFYDNAEDAERLGKEIIEIGWALMEPLTGVVVESKQFYVKPTKGYVSEKCSRLTGATNERLATAESFLATMGEVHQLHRRLGIKVWGAFGHYDRDMLADQCAAENVPNPWVDQRFFNVRELAGAYFGSGKRPPGLAKALGLVGLEFEGTEHCGKDDAVNTARLLARLLGR